MLMFYNFLSLDKEDNHFIKILGLQWCPQTDSFFFSVKIIESSITERNILSQIPRIFDPLGFLSPMTLIAKLIIQLWAMGLALDDSLPKALANKWLKFKNKLPSISNFKLNHYLDISNDCVTTCVLCGFIYSCNLPFGCDRSGVSDKGSSS